MDSIWKGTFEIWQNSDFGKIYAQYIGRSIFTIGSNQVFVSHKALIGNTTLYIYCPSSTKVIEDAIKLARGLKAGRVWLYTVDEIEQFSDFFQKKEFTFIMDLSLSENEILAKMTPNRRNEIRRAQREGLIIDIAKTKKEFNEWWKIYANAASIERFKIQPYDLVIRLFETPSLSRLFVALFNGKIVGGAFFLTGKYPMYWLGAVNKDYKALNVGAFNIYKAMLQFKYDGYMLLDFGGAVLDCDHGPTLFKKKFGGDIANGVVYIIPICHGKAKLMDIFQKFLRFMYSFPKLSDIR